MFALLPVNVRLAIRSLNRNRLRTVLTMLGIIIGVGAVLTMVALGTGARASVQGEVASAGTNLIYVRAGNYTRGGESVGIVAGAGAATTLTPQDAEVIAQRVDGITELSPGVSMRTFLVSADQRAFARIQGISAGFSRVYSWNMTSGKMLEESADQAVMGTALANQMFGSAAAAVGKQITLRDVTFTVTGVTDGQAEDHAEVLFVPWRRLQQILGIEHLQTITIAAQKAGETSRIADEIKALLRERHGMSAAASDSPAANYLAQQRSVGSIPDDFTVQTQAAQALTKGLYTPAAAFALANLPKLDEVTLEEMADTLDRASDTMTALLASIAGVSLVVGGIGIMNIMLVSITERTREIGLRRATGARSVDVALQFLVEAVTLSVIGGVVGLILGLLSARLVGWSLGWPTEVPMVAMVGAIGIATLVGLVFGSYPARRASQLDPIDALRTE